MTVQPVAKRPGLCCNTGIGEKVPDVKTLGENRLRLQLIVLELR